MRAILAMIALTMVPTLASCASSLPVPCGPCAVGTTVVEFRYEPKIRTAGKNAESVRRLYARVWYPASDTSGRVPVRPISANQTKALQRLMGFPPALANGIRATASFDGAPPLVDSARPALIFSHGAYSFETQSFSLMQELASSGFVVFSLNHPGESLVSEFSDGSLVWADLGRYKSDSHMPKSELETLGREFHEALESIRSSEGIEGKRAGLERISRYSRQRPTLTPHSGFSTASATSRSQSRSSSSTARTRRSAPSNRTWTA